MWASEEVPLSGLNSLSNRTFSVGIGLGGYNQELELNCDVLLLMALQQMLNFADDYLDDVGPV